MTKSETLPQHPNFSGYWRLLKHENLDTFLKVRLGSCASTCLNSIAVFKQHTSCLLLPQRLKAVL